jgi:D-tyrosyl-tRNA(Tyr) deacylase
MRRVTIPLEEEGGGGHFFFLNPCHLCTVARRYPSPNVTLRLLFFFLFSHPPRRLPNFTTSVFRWSETTPTFEFREKKKKQSVSSLLLEMSSARVVLQAVDQASLLVDNVAKYVSIRKGVIVYVTFLVNASEATLPEMVNAILSTKVFALHSPTVDVPSSSSQAPMSDSVPRDRPKPVSIAESSCDVLIVPQASLAGKIKGKVMQYHSQAPKDVGLTLYTAFCNQVRLALVSETTRGEWIADGNGVVVRGEPCDETQSVPWDGRLVLNGTYGNRQALQLASSGPFSHILDF